MPTIKRLFIGMTLKYCNDVEGVANIFVKNSSLVSSYKAVFLNTFASCLQQKYFVFVVTQKYDIDVGGVLIIVHLFRHRM